MHDVALANGLRRADVPQLGLSVIYPPRTFAATHLAEFIANWQEASAYVHQRLGVDASVPMTVDLRADGAADPLGLGVRGYSVPAAGRMYQLYDGSGDPGDREYITAHELGHMIIYHRDGAGANLMLSEGIAMYASDEFLRRDRVTTLDDFAEAAYLAKRLTPLTTLSAPNAGFHGRLVDRLDYDLAGAFVRYLIDTYGWQKFDRVYPTANYLAAYGEPLPQMNQEWIAFLAARSKQHPLGFDASVYFAYLDRVSRAYTRLYDAAAQNDDRLNLPAYQDVDAARLAVDRHDYSAADQFLAVFERAI